MKRARHTRRHIPAELVVEILLNLPVESLLRFSTVSRSWNTTILRAEFATRYRGRESIALKFSSDGEEKFLSCPISALSTAAPPFSLPLKGANWYTDVSCGGLRCVELGDTLCLYNPSTRTFRKLPPPSCPPLTGYTKISDYCYGLGYDSVAGDYKVLKTPLNLRGETELYSLKSDRWREVRDSEARIQRCIAGGEYLGFVTRRGVFVAGVLYWLVWHAESRFDILTFDVSTESYGKAAMPPLPEAFLGMICSSNTLSMCVLRGRLSVCFDYSERFVVWIMEEAGNWVKDLEIDYSIPSVPKEWEWALTLYGHGF